MVLERLGVRERAIPVVRAGMVLGAGLGAFFDGIVFHQVLQWHHMLSAHPDPAVAGDLPLNVFADGLFHVGAYLLTILGVVLLWRARRRGDVPTAGRAVVGSVLAGWGAFNLVEGLVNHHLLELHHVWPAGPGSPAIWDLGFLAWGIAMLAVGYAFALRDPTARQGGSPARER